ncbi:T9SS type B sorting domain-containing protein, partial [Crocinitomix algicola]|uniref:T9SS type B sorting domain-containing protein n=1 Tax=Crocinitomix algicola TaxID=1740263 RepID=UPI001112D9F0
DIITACDAYTWIDGITYTSDEFAATHTLTNAVGCDSVVTLNLTINESTTGIDFIEACESYTWIDGLTYTSDEFAATYTLATVDGCDSVVTLNLTIHPAPLVEALASSGTICFGETVTLTGAGAATYTWDGGVLDGVPFEPMTIGTSTFTVTGTSAAGCESTASISIVVEDCNTVDPAFEINGALCVGNCVQINDLSTGGPIAGYEWNFGAEISPSTSTEQNPEICLTSPGVYIIELITTNINGSTYTTTEEIIVHDLPDLEAKYDTIIDLGGSAMLIANSSEEGDYSWSPDKTVECSDCPITTGHPIEDETYTVIFIDEFGCKTSDSVSVLVNFIEGIGVPTAFSPNEDGINDVLYVKGYAITAMNFKVYNRYGELVFETDQQNIGWDGTYLNRAENPGVFTWVLGYQLNNGKRGVLKGNTTLMR